MAFLSGKYTHQVDDRGRIRIPTKFKEFLGENPFVTVGTEKCLVVYPQEHADKLFAEKFKEVDGISSNPMLKRMRLMLSKSSNLEEDKQGRVTIQSFLIEHAGIKKNIVSIGMLNRVEIWDEDVWNEYESSLEAESDEE